MTQYQKLRDESHENYLRLFTLQKRLMEMLADAKDAEDENMVVKIEKSLLQIHKVQIDALSCPLDGWVDECHGNAEIPL